MQQEKKFPTLGDYLLIKSLGTGLNSKVKLGYNKQDGSYHAIKIMKTTGKQSLNERAINTEVSIMSHLHHPNLINLIKPQTIDQLVKPDGSTKKVLYIVLEYAEGGELFDYIANTGNFTEEMARFYLHQLIEAVDYLHRQNFSHRDLKPENILLDKNFNLKLADFGFTTVMEGRDGLGKLRTQLGTESYMAPEINLKLSYSGVAIDLFAIGIILFVMSSGNPPFNRADPKDIYFKQLCTNKHQVFWDAHLKFKEKKEFYTEGFKSVLNSLLAFDPTQRMTLAELQMHSWIKGKKATLAEVQQEMDGRRKKLNLIKEKNRVQKALDKEQKKIGKENTMEKDGICVGFGNFRGGNDAGKEFAAIKAKFNNLEAERDLYKYYSIGDEEIQGNNNVYSNLNPQQLFYALTKECSGKFNLVKLHENMMKIICENQKEDEELIKFTIKIYKYNENLNSIEFERKSGPIIMASQEINNLKEFISAI